MSRLLISSVAGKILCYYATYVILSSVIFKGFVDFTASFLVTENERTEGKVMNAPNTYRFNGCNVYRADSLHFTYFIN